MLMNTLYTNMADHSVVVDRDELCESAVSWASVFIFDNASLENPCFVGDLVCFILLCLRVFVFRHICIGCII